MDTQTQHRQQEDLTHGHTDTHGQGDDMTAHTVGGGRHLLPEILG